MNLETFTEIVNDLTALHARERAADKLGIDLSEWADGYYAVINKLLIAEFGKEGYDVLYWFIYELPSMSEGTHAWDKDGNPICYDIPSLFDHLAPSPTDEAFREFKQ